MSVYFGLKMFVFTDHPFLGGFYTYLSIAEVSLLIISIFLTYDLARSMAEYERVIEKVTFPKHSNRVLEMKEAQEGIRTEFVRSRRHNRPLTVMLVRMNPSTVKGYLEQIVMNIQKAMVNRFLLASLAKILTTEARRTDMIIEQDDKDGFILLCPETSTEGSIIMAERIQSMAMERLGVSVDCGVASFPDEALTFEDLVQKAEFHTQSPEILAAYKFNNSHELTVDPKKTKFNQ
jgi:GGDEF domain-containing protein